MSNSNQQKVYAPFFGKVKTFNNGGEIFNISGKADELIEFINKNKNSKGYINFDISKQRNDATKLSVSLDTWEPSTANRTDQVNITEDDEDLGLPF